MDTTTNTNTTAPEASNHSSGEENTSILKGTIDKLSTRSAYIWFSICITVLTTIALVLATSDKENITIPGKHGKPGKSFTVEMSDKATTIVSACVISLGILLLFMIISLTYIKTFRMLTEFVGKVSGVIWLFILDSIDCI